MFFKQVWRNAAANRKGNGLFFGSLVTAIIAFYTLLSLGEQDVMIFLSSVESDAVRKLLDLLPLVWALSLFFVFFLVYFACRYQTDNRRRELGMYLMLGMKRSRMFFMLFCETLLSGVYSLLMGIPAALLLTEGISLATANIAGLGIIGHHFSLSPEAILWTVAGYIIVQLSAMLIICIGLGKKQPAELLSNETEKKQELMSSQKSTALFICGIVLLLFAYYLGVFRMRSFDIPAVLGVMVFGISGTFLFFGGLGGFIGRRIVRKSPYAAGLETFTARQVQETVSTQHRSLAVSSLLLLTALACMSYGISMGVGRSVSSRSADFSLFGTAEQTENALNTDGIGEMFKDSYPMYISMVKDGYGEGEESSLDLADLKGAIGSVEGSDNMLRYMHIEYMITESSYNRLLRNIGKEEIRLEGQKVAMYSSQANEGDFGTILQKALAKGPHIGIDGTDYEILPELYFDNAVADRGITLSMALIVPDGLYWRLARYSEPFCINAHIKDEAVEKQGLMQAVQAVDEKLSGTGIEYDSFLQGIGRNLFYTVAASYITVYLGILFLIIANTVIGMKFLIQQRQTKHRYVTLSMLGADTEAMCRSVKKQIQIYFLPLLCLAAISGAAAVWAMLTSFAKLPSGTSFAAVVLLASAALLFFVLTEVIYIGIVKRTASREIRKTDITDRS